MVNELLLAAINGKLEVIQQAIKNGDDLSFAKDTDGNTSFLLAAKHAEATYGIPKQGHTKIIRAMLQSGAGKDYIAEYNKLGENALLLVIKAKSMHAVHALYEYYYKDHPEDWKKHGNEALFIFFNGRSDMQSPDLLQKIIIGFMHNRGIGFGLPSCNESALEAAKLAQPKNSPPAAGSVPKYTAATPKEIEEERSRLGEALFTAICTPKIREGYVIENVEGVRECLDKGADYTYRNPKTNYNSAIDTAVTLGRIEILDFLVSRGASLTELHPIETYPLLIAAYCNQMRMVKHLLGSKYRLSETTCNTSGATIAHLAALKGHQELTEYLLDTYPHLRDSKTEIGDTPLMLTLRKGYTKLFIDLTRKYNLQLEMGKAAQKDGTTALHIAAFKDDVLTINFLIDECKAKVHQPTLVGLSSVFLAVQHGKLAALQALQNKVGFDFASPRNRAGMDLLQWAEHSKQLHIVAFLRPHFTTVAASATASAVENKEQHVTEMTNQILRDLQEQLQGLQRATAIRTGAASAAAPSASPAFRPSQNQSSSNSSATAANPAVRAASDPIDVLVEFLGLASGNPRDAH